MKRYMLGHKKDYSGKNYQRFWTRRGADRVCRYLNQICKDSLVPQDYYVLKIEKVKK